MPNATQCISRARHSRTPPCRAVAPIAFSCTAFLERGGSFTSYAGLFCPNHAAHALPRDTHGGCPGASSSSC